MITRGRAKKFQETAKPGFFLAREPRCVIKEAAEIQTEPWDGRHRGTPHPDPTVVELVNEMKIFSFLNVHCKYIVYLNWECEPFLRPSRLISWSLSNRCGSVSAILLSSLATECDRKILRASGN